LRVAAASVLCFRALVVDSENQSDMKTFGCNLGLDEEFMNQLKAQVDD
jgi:hypothetical protein